MNNDIQFVRGLFDNGLDAVAVFDTNLVVAYWNAELERLSGVASERAVGLSIHDLYPASTAVAGGFLRRALTGECLIAQTPFFAAADPVRAKECEWFVMPLLQQGRISGCVVVVQQMADRVDLQSHIREVEQRFRSMANSSPVLLWMAGADGLCNFFNDSWLHFTGRSMQQESGVGWIEGVHPEDFRQCMDCYMDAFISRLPFEMEYRLRRHDGDYRWILDRGAPRYLDSGVFAGYIGSCVDITERRNAEQDAHLLAADLSRANEYMEQLLYAASHDLREPIRMVTVFLDLLQKHTAPLLDAEARSYIEFASEGAQRMKSLVSSLLDLSQTRARVPEFREVDTTAIVHSVLRDLNGAVIDSQACVLYADLPVVRADPVLFHSLMQNLLGNAIKFRGGRPLEVVVSAQRIADEWLFAVRDNGIGFLPEYAEVIFEAFRRLHTREAYPGNGLGLALAREIVIRHHGRIWASSTPGAGSEFQFTLPLRN